MPLSDFVQMCEISSIFCFCDVFSTHIKSFSHSVSLGSSHSVPLWVSGMVCLLRIKRNGSKLFLQMFIYRGAASEKLSLCLAVCKLIDLFGLARLHASHIWCNQINNYVVSDFMFGSSCDILNRPQTSLAGFNVLLKKQASWIKLEKCWIWNTE